MKLDMVGIIVSSMESAILFYERLGFQISGNKTEDYVELSHTGIRISLNSKKMIEGVYGFVPNTTGDRIELAFLCQSKTEIDQKCAQLKEFGYQIVKEPWLAFWGQYYALIRDVDGNMLSLFCDGKV